MATNTTTQKEENPIKTLTQQQPSEPHSTENPNSTSPALQQLPSSTAANASNKDDGDDSKATTGDPTAVNSDKSGDSVTDTQKKIRRAERFGMAVQLSEEEKRNSRAERFGTGSGLHGSDATKKLEEQKRKTRAERFGIVQSVPADEEVKKKARLARFAPVSNTDSVEEDKKKARALRFSQASSSISQVNGEGNIEPKPAIVGKAGGGA